MRLISFDTETTGMTRIAGKPVCEGHRVIELACVELSDHQTPPHFHAYYNPGRAVDAGAFAVHGLSDAFLKDKKRFEHHVEEFLSFIKGATLIAHNAAFDLQFLNQELAMIGLEPLTSYCHEVIDTLVIARQRFPGKKNSLDALCQRYNIDLSERQFHGALKDSLLLLQVYRKMTGGQVAFVFQGDQIRDEQVSLINPIPTVALSTEEMLAHEEFLQRLL